MSAQAAYFYQHQEYELFCIYRFWRSCRLGGVDPDAYGCTAGDTPQRACGNRGSGPWDMAFRFFRGSRRGERFQSGEFCGGAHWGGRPNCNHEGGQRIAFFCFAHVLWGHASLCPGTLNVTRIFFCFMAEKVCFLTEAKTMC